MNRVLRVEDREGRGMYCGAPCPVAIAGLPITPSDRHPMPYNDSLFMRNWERLKEPWNGYVFGFTSEQQLLSWLYSDAARAKLAEQGLRLNVYEVQHPHLVVGYSQCTFHRGLAIRVGQLDLVTLEPC